MKRATFCIAAALAIVQLRAQTIDSTLARYSDQFVQEKTYLHYDKASYYAGETIWFKAYLMAGIYPGDQSKTFYVDWIGDNGTVLNHTVSPLVDGATNGQFEIPLDYKGDFIHVRAYTKWMLNFDTAFLYNKDIRILSKTTAAAAKTARPAVVPSLQFFPEGGDAIEGVSNRIAFKAADQWGRPVRIRGIVQDAKGGFIDSLRVLHDGMGFLFVLPQPGGVYTAKWRDEKGADHTTALPAARSSGVAMQVLTSKTQRIINLLASPQLPQELQQLHILGTLNQHEAFRAEVALQPGGTARRIIPIQNLPSGILTITLFDAAWNAVSERITFVNNQDYSFTPTMEVQHWGLSKRKRNDVQLTLPDSLQGASLSISVTDAAIERDTTDNIIAHLLLSSEIRGEVYNAAYYFSGNTETLAQQLDLVMLTNGWRRFKWEDVAKGKLPVINYPRDTTYMTLSGKLFGVTRSQLSGKESIVLIVKSKDSTTKMLVEPINTDATFRDPGVILFDTVQVYYSLKSKFLGLAEAKFMTDRLPAPNYAAFSKRFIARNPFFDTTGSAYHTYLGGQAARMMEERNGKMMEAVTVTARPRPTTDAMDQKYASALFQGGDGYQFDLVNDNSAMGYPTIFNYLQGRVAGLQINQSGGTATLSWRGSSPALYLDEIPTDADMLGSVPVSDIAYVKVLRPPFMGSPNGAGGAIAIYTRKGNDQQATPGRGLNSNKVSGYTPIREFYSPNYDRFDQRNDQPDIRTTLFWSPALGTTPQKRTVNFSFYNNDVSKSFRVVVEGMTRDGLLTHFEQIME